jgi:hypothetical protein
MEMEIGSGSYQHRQRVRTPVTSGEADDKRKFIFGETSTTNQKSIFNWYKTWLN